MSKLPVHHGFRTRVGWVAAFVLAIHIGLCLLFAINHASWVRRTLPGVFYRHLVLTGPFFKESVIQSSDRLYYRYKPAEGSWTTFEENSEIRFRSYRERPWKYGEFIRGDYIRRQSYKLEGYQKKRTVDASKAPAPLRRINHYILAHIGGDIDSINIVSVRDRYDLPAGRIQADTVYSLTYSPRQIE